MPLTQVVFFRAENGAAPVFDWLRELKTSDFKSWIKCVERVEQLRQFGHELRRPAGDFLRDGIYELRARSGRVNYRLLYFFHGRNVAILAHAITKEDAIPAVDLQRALSRKSLYQKNSLRHTYDPQTPL